MEIEHNSNARLDRIEAKLDKLTTIVAQLARIEERSSNQQVSLDRMGSRLDNYEDRIEVLEISHATTTGVTHAVKLFWAGVIGIAGLIIGYHSR